MKENAASEAAQRLAIVQNRSEVSFLARSLLIVRYNFGDLKPRPVIATIRDNELKEDMNTREPEFVYVMATFEKRPAASIHALYRHFLRHTDSLDTPPCPLEGKGPIMVRPKMRYLN
jgi:hypothetical protein